MIIDYSHYISLVFLLEQRIAVIRRIGYFRRIFKIYGKFWQRSDLRYYSNRKAHTFSPNLVLAGYPESRGLSLVTGQRRRGKCAY